MTSPNSTVLYSEPDLNKLLGYVGHIKQVGRHGGFSACVVGKSSILTTSSSPDGFPRPLDDFLQ